jgi:hypothetical protein
MPCPDQETLKKQTFLQHLKDHHQRSDLGKIIGAVEYTTLKYILILYIILDKNLLFSS